MSPMKRHQMKLLHLFFVYLINNKNKKFHVQTQGITTNKQKTNKHVIRLHKPFVSDRLIIMSNIQHFSYVLRLKGKTENTATA